MFALELLIVSLLFRSVSALAPPLVARGTASEVNGALNVSLNTQVWPPAILGQSTSDGLKAFCVGCNAQGSLSVSGGDGNETPDANFTRLASAAGFDFTTAWAGVAIDNFTMHVELAIDLAPTNGSAEMTVHLLGAPLTFGAREGPLGLTATFDPQIYGKITTNKPVNFTYGFDLVVPSGAALLLPLLHPGSAVAIGFNESMMTPLPLQATSGDLSLTFELAFRPTYTLTATLIEPISATLVQDVPALTLTVSQVSNVTAACARPVAQTDRVFSQLTRADAVVGVDATFAVAGESVTPLNATHSLAPACFSFDEKAKKLVAAADLTSAARSLAVPAAAVFAGLVAGLMVLA